MAKIIYNIITLVLITKVRALKVTLVLNTERFFKASDSDERKTYIPFNQFTEFDEHCFVITHDLLIAEIVFM